MLCSSSSFPIPGCTVLTHKLRSASCSSSPRPVSEWPTSPSPSGHFRKPSTLLQSVQAQNRMEPQETETHTHTQWNRGIESCMCSVFLKEKKKANGTNILVEIEISVGSGKLEIVLSTKSLRAINKWRCNYVKIKYHGHPNKSVYTCQLDCIHLNHQWAWSRLRYNFKQQVQTSLSGIARSFWKPSIFS